MSKRLFLALLVLVTIFLSACSNTGNVVYDGSSDVCIPRYDVNGNDLNNCGAVGSTDDSDEMSDLDKLLSDIEKSFNDSNGSEDLPSADSQDTVLNEEVISDAGDSSDVESTPSSEVASVPVVSEDGILVKNVIEGDLVELKPRVVDPDGDSLKITFSYPLDENGKWYTKEGDAGNYDVKVTASDGKTVSEQKVRIIVAPMNKAPVITIPDELIFKEGEKIVLSPEVVDPEGSDVTVTFSGWLDSDTYQTTYDDAGTYSVTVFATDGDKESSKKIKIMVENTNRAPVIESMKKISVVEEDIVVVTPVVSDPDGDSITVTFDSPFDSDGKWNTKVGDAGDYEFSVVASDGDLEARKTVEIFVDAKNKPPVLQKISEIVVNEGDTVKISPVAIDPEGEKLTFSYSGWMKSDSYKTTYSDAGNYVVTVTVSDGVYTASQDVKVTVKDVNRAPEFSCIVDCE